MHRLTIVQSCLCKLKQQPQSLLWKLHGAVDNTPRQKAMQPPKSRQDGSPHSPFDVGRWSRGGAIGKATLPNSPKFMSHFFCYLGRMPSCLAMRFAMANSLVSPPPMYALLHTNTRHKKVRDRETDVYRAHCILAPQAREGHKPYQWTPLPQYGAAMIQPTSAYDFADEAFHNEPHRGRDSGCPHPGRKWASLIHGWAGPASVGFKIEK